MITATRRIQFCAGHRVYKHESKCANVHGHNYVVFFTAGANELDELGRVIDFSVLKEKLGGWIEEHWDHGWIYFADDPIGNHVAHLGNPVTKSFEMDTNPTAENMAAFLLRVVGPDVLAGTGVNLLKVVLWETENCYAEAKR